MVVYEEVFKVRVYEEVFIRYKVCEKNEKIVKASIVCLKNVTHKKELTPNESGDFHQNSIRNGLKQFFRLSIYSDPLRLETFRGE